MKEIKQMKKWQWAFVGFLAIATVASIILEFMGPHEAEAGHHWWSGIPLFWILFGAVGCAAITIFAKLILGPIIFKKEDYYHDNE